MFYVLQQRIMQTSLDLINKIGKPFDAKEKEGGERDIEMGESKRKKYILQEKVMVVYKVLYKSSFHQSYNSS